jgi:hypothetical protein
MMKTALGLPMIAKHREAFFASRPMTYIGVILAAALAASAYRIWDESIFSCPATGYSSDRYIAYCNGAGYADYEHGAFQFGLEPAAQDFARKADVLFLGNSRLQFAFSTAATSDWFSAASARYYLLGFSYDENVIFTDGILCRIHPHAKVYVINVDNFFDRSETPPVQTILHDPEAQNRYEMKRLWQRIHEPVCKRFPVLCGNSAVIFRSRETGAYTKRTSNQQIKPVSYDQVISQDVVNSNTAAAIDFLSHLSVERKCVILTMVPTVGTKIENVKAIAAALGNDLVMPDVPSGLQTYDGSHLDQQSAERWSQAFFQAASSGIRSCLARQPRSERTSGARLPR